MPTNLSMKRGCIKVGTPSLILQNEVTTSSDVIPCDMGTWFVIMKWAIKFPAAFVSTWVDMPLVQTLISDACTLTMKTSAATVFTDIRCVDSCIQLWCVLQFNYVTATSDFSCYYDELWCKSVICSTVSLSPGSYQFTLFIEKRVVLSWESTYS